MRTLLGIYAFVIGLCFGSFSLATAWRLKKHKRIFGDERSVCEHCRRQLRAMDLVPVVSWLLARGKCRYCHAALSPLFPFAEILGGIAFASSVLFWPGQFTGMLHKASFGLWLISLVLLLILFLYDLQWYQLPNKVVYPLWLVSGVSFLVTLWQKPTLHTFLLGITAVAVGGGVFWVLFELSKGKWIGFGDVRLGVAIGLLVGTPLMAALVIFLSSVIGVLAALPGIVTGKKTLQSKLPYGPLLIIALVVVKLFGQRAIDWYTVHLLYI